MQNTSDDQPRDPRRAPSSSGKALTYVIILGVAAGVLMLGGLGVYGFITYFGGDDSDTADALLGQETENLAASPTALATGIPAEVGRQSLKDPIAATATAACGLFLSQFPGTPCPPAGVQEADMTATAACERFISEFPGTPCP
jgi:hypothetical protein